MNSQMTGYPSMDKPWEMFCQKIEYSFKKYSNKVALRLVGTENPCTYTYGDLTTQMQKYRLVCRELGLQRGDRVAICTPHSIYGVQTVLCLILLGYTTVLIDAGLPLEEIKRLIDYSDAQALFTTGDLLCGLGVLTDISCVEMEDVDKEYSIVNICERKTGIAQTDEDVAAIIFSSGTTGTLKGVQITYKSLIRAYECMVEYTNLSEKITYLNVLPVNHIAGFSAAMSCFLAGAEMGFLLEVNAQTLSNAFQLYNPTNFIMIPKIYEIIREKVLVAVNKNILTKIYYIIGSRVTRWFRIHTGHKIRWLLQPIRKAALGKNIQICGCGTAPCSEEVISFYLDLGIDFVNVYGSTETGFPITATNCNTQRYPIYGAGNVHQFTDVRIQIAEPDGNGVGEVYVASPMIMKGYFKDNELTKMSFDGEYFKTGDLGYIDQDGNLYITGRKKEIILLHNGKKVAPGDVEKLYQSCFHEGENIACCGIPTGEGYDEIHLFIEGQTDIDELRQRIRGRSLELPQLYRLKGIHKVTQFPRTSVGKIKRFELQKMINTDVSKNNNLEINEKTNVEEGILAILKQVAEKKDITLAMKLADELELDSLDMFTLSAKIEEHFGVNLVEALGEMVTGQDLVSAVKSGGYCRNNTRTYDINDFPKEKEEKDLKRLYRWMKWSHRIWKFEVSGLENIPECGNYILAPNHESHLDGLWTISCIQNGNINYKKFCCMAKEEHLDTKFTKRFLDMLGGIPVERTGNSAIAIQRAISCVENGYYLLIHPEGTRTRDGKLGNFKEGAALVSQQAGVPIVPVRIEGAREIYPPHKKLPRIIGRKGRYTLHITFCEAVIPNNDLNSMTMEIRDKIG